jgi:hypothetical protein
MMQFLRRASLLVAFSLLGSAVAVTAQQTPEASVLSSLLAARSLKCSFNTYAVADWKSGKPNVTRGHEDFGFHFDSIDVKAQKARLIGSSRRLKHFRQPPASGQKRFFIKRRGCYGLLTAWMM